MKPPTEFLQGLGIGAGLIAVLAAISLVLRPGATAPVPTRPASIGNIEPRAAGEAPASFPADYLDLCRRAGL